MELLPRSQWRAESQSVREDDGFDAGDTLEADKLILAEDFQESEVQPTGKVVGIVKRKWRQYCGILMPNPVKTANRHIFCPAEKKIPKIRVETRQANKLRTMKIVVAIDSWPRNSRYPLGHFVRCLGEAGSKATENEVLLLEHDIPHSKFSDAVLECLPAMPWSITNEDLEKRVDCRHLDICSVDPPGCTDIDDALHCRSLRNGNFEVGVHIAGKCTVYYLRYFCIIINFLHFRRFPLHPSRNRHRQRSRQQVHDRVLDRPANRHGSRVVVLQFMLPSRRRRKIRVFLRLGNDP